MYTVMPVEQFLAEVSRKILVFNLTLTIRSFTWDWILSSNAIRVNEMLFLTLKKQNQNLIQRQLT